MANSQPKKKALVISVSKYDDQELDQLSYVYNDGTQMSQVLKNAGFEIDDDRKLIGPVNYDKMRRGIIRFFRDNTLNPEDMLLLYYSGHGDTDGHRDRFFCTTEYDRNAPDEYGVPFNLITKQITKSNAKKIIVILDCCFSGGLVLEPGKSGDAKGEDDAEKQGNEAINEEFADSQGLCVLASSLSNRKSFKHPQKELSAFTNFLIEGLNKNPETMDENGHVTPERLDNFVFRKLKNLVGGNLQKPQRTAQVAGKLILADYSDSIIPEPNPNIIPADNNEDQLLNLLQNCEIDKFNELRERNRQIPVKVNAAKLRDGANLSGIDLTDTSISRTNFKGITLQEANFTNSGLDGAVFIKVNLEKAQFSRARLNDSDFSGATLDSCNFFHAEGNKVEFWGANMNNANFEDARLSETNFSDGKMLGAKLAGAKLFECDFRKADLKGADFNGANLKMSHFEESNLEDTNFQAADLTNASFLGSTLNNTKFARATLKNAYFSAQSLNLVDFSDANLLGADFRDADLSKANLSRAVLKDAKLQNAILAGAYLQGADLFAANLKGADLRGAQLEGANLTDVILDNAQMDEDVKTMIESGGQQNQELDNTQSSDGATSNQTQSSSKHAKKALVFGLSKYDSAELEEFHTFSQNGLQLSTLLKNQRYNVVTRADRTNSIDLKKHMIEFFRNDQVKPEDVLLFYFSGYGFMDSFGGSYFGTSDIDRQMPEINGVPLSFLKEQMARSNSMRNVAILDFNFLGDIRGIRGDQDAQESSRESMHNDYVKGEKNGICILASSLPSKEFMKDRNEVSTFTQLVMNGLKGEGSALDEHKEVTIESLNEYVVGNMSKLQLQIPAYTITTSGRVVLSSIDDVNVALTDDVIALAKNSNSNT